MSFPKRNPADPELTWKGRSTDPAPWQPWSWLWRGLPQVSSLPLCILKIQRSFKRSRGKAQNSVPLLLSSKVKRGFPRMSLIDITDLFNNIPPTPQPQGPGREGPGTASAQGCKNHSYMKCHWMAKIYPRPTFKEACPSIWVTESNLKGDSRHGECAPGPRPHDSFPCSMLGGPGKASLTHVSAPNSSPRAWSPTIRFVLLG